MLRFWATLLALLAMHSAYAQRWPYLARGPYKVGFALLPFEDKYGHDLSASIWYPAESGATAMTLRDYIISGKEQKGMADTAAVNEFKRILELPFLFHLHSIPKRAYEQAISKPLHASKDAKMLQGKFPLVVAFASPRSYAETFEFFASHGIAVACVFGRLPGITNDSLLYVNATNALDELLQMMKTKPYVDTAHIAAFGHGGGIQPAFYLAMRTQVVKAVINLDGGVFNGPRAKTSLSPDYKPGNFKAPMLDILTQETAREEDTALFNALANTRYRVVVPHGTMHHDFTEFGRVANCGLHERGKDGGEVDKIFAMVNTLMLRFLQQAKLDTTGISSGFTVTMINKK